MIRLEDIVRNIRAARAAPGDEDLRKLPHGKAFIYGRVSSPGQVRQSLESIKDIARLLELGARSFRVEFVNEEPAEVTRTLEKYQLLLRGEISGADLWRELKLLHQLGVTRGQMETAPQVIHRKQ